MRSTVSRAPLRTVPMVLLALVVATSVVGCSSRGSSSPSTTGAGPTSSTSAGPTTTAAALPGAGTTPTSLAGVGPSQVALMNALRAARQTGFDRVVFEFEGPTVPPANVAYRERPILEDASGNEVTVAGAAVLEVRMFPASGVDLSGTTFREVYTGPRRLSPADTRVVDEVVRTGDFEAVLTWVIGTSGRVPFLVSTLTNPSRLVVDLQG